MSATLIAGRVGAAVPGGMADGVGAIEGGRVGTVTGVGADVGTAAAHAVKQMLERRSSAIVFICPPWDAIRHTRRAPRQA